MLGEKKLVFWAKPSWSVGRKETGVLGETKLECWANTNCSVGQQQVGVLGENISGSYLNIHVF